MHEIIAQGLPHFWAEGIVECAAAAGRDRTVLSLRRKRRPDRTAGTRGAERRKPGSKGGMDHALHVGQERPVAGKAWRKKTMVYAWDVAGRRISAGMRGGEVQQVIGIKRWLELPVCKEKPWM
jgi:hypothetical protein